MKQEFRFPIENHFRDQGLQSLFPQSECSPNSLSDSREDAENEAERKTLDAEMQRGGKEAFCAVCSNNPSETFSFREERGVNLRSGQGHP